MIFLFCVFFYPNILGHSDNYIPANPLVTPSHIVPEWYFLPFYAILRSIPDKLFGVLAMFGSLVIILLLPNIVNIKKNNQIVSIKILNPEFRPFSRFFFWVFVLDVVLLGWLGGKPVENPYLELGLCATFYYFFHLVFLLPFLFKLEQKWLYTF